MLTEEQIRRALRATRVIPLETANPHGPLGLEQLAAAVARRTADAQTQQPSARVRRSIELAVETWEKLDQLAAAASQSTSAAVKPSDLAATIIEEYLATNRRAG